MKIDELLPEETAARSSKYLTNLNHCKIKSRVNAMLGFKHCRNAVATIAWIELMYRIRKGQFESPSMRLRYNRACCLDGRCFNAMM
ncbi:hypothetical protein AWB81_07990 [Caballeronia arationis]|nr:hypothetical protein AWB81_07990 [Caballeronia arationis]